MIKYNWEKIFRETNGDSTSILTIVHLLTYKRIPASKKDRTYKYFGKSFVGDSFLLNPEFIYKHRKSASDSEWAEYIAVASYRSYNDYLINNKITLELARFPKGVQHIIKRNRLFKIENDIVHFLYEKSHKEK